VWASHRQWGQREEVIRTSGMTRLEVKLDAGRGVGEDGSQQGPFDGARPVGSWSGARSHSPQSARALNASARETIVLAVKGHIVQW
jgi:hypothetical protein